MTLRVAINNPVVLLAPTPAQDTARCLNLATGSSERELAQFYLNDMYFQHETMGSIIELVIWFCVQSLARNLSRARLGTQNPALTKGFALDSSHASSS